MRKLIQNLNIGIKTLPSFYKHNSSITINLISYTMFIYFGILAFNILYIQLIGSELGTSMGLLEIAPYSSLSFTSSLYNTEDKENLYLYGEVENSNWRNLPLLQKAVRVYDTPVTDWKQITKDLKDKSGIYCWINKINKKFYIGSASLLPKRLSYYFQPAYINKIDMIITKSLLKYGLINFALVILEETSNNKKEILEREDFYLKTLKPEYNILTKAGNSLGYKHTPEAILKLSLLNKGKKHTDLAKAKIGAAKLGTKLSTETKEKIRETLLNSEICLGDKVLITDLEENKTILFKSKLAAAKYLGLTVSAIRHWHRERKEKPLALTKEII